MSQQAADHNIFPWDTENWILDTEISGDKRLPDLDLNALIQPEIPPPQKRLRTAGSAKGKEVVVEIDEIDDPNNDLHILTERERRKKMGGMFSTLLSFFPHLPPKAKKSTIVEETICEIKRLEGILERLQKKRNEKIRGALLSGEDSFSREALMADQVKNFPVAASSKIRFHDSFNTWSSHNLVVSVTGADAHISICASTKRGLLSSIVRSLEKHNLTVLSATVSCDFFRSMFMIHAQANGGPDSFPVETPFEEIFRSAMVEIMTWIS